MAGHSGWQVTSQVSDQVVLTNAGQAVTGTYVYFTTGDGNSGSVFIDDAHYSAPNVHKAITTRAAELDAVGRLAAAPG